MDSRNRQLSNADLRIGEGFAKWKPARAGPVQLATAGSAV